ncbi:alpha/beta hydrolase [Rhodococcoides yunnanense]|uniref:alpha/beta hydrolase n=1 Tax=Rhodococcoides yunnanense TaxID=278209 RepID=UPI000932D044|nr:alpha/beta hydrolase [Rhodococcus yunnanensis]
MKLGPTTAAVAATGILVAACAPTDPPPEPAPDVPPASWAACPDDFDSTGMQCATVPVPLDYDDPGGEQIELTISRLASKNPDERRGVLLLNPGGPGGTGVDQPTFLESMGMPQSVLDSYDLIGIDTRGVGHSSPISCGFTDDIGYYGAVPPYAFDDAAFDEQASVAQEVAARCAANDDGRLQHVTTANMARDLDRIRASLGEDKASFLGYSYGTALGAAYASMFPETSDRIVLDSNIGDTYLDHDGMRRYSRGMEETFPDFAKWAAANHDRYGLGSTPEEVRSTYFAIADRLDRASVDGIDGRLFRLATFATLYNPRSYETAAENWVAMRDGTPDGEQPPIPATPSTTDNTWSVFLAVTCNDAEWPDDPATYRQAIREDSAAYPLFGAAAANIMPCAFWQSEPEAPVAIDDDGPTNILIAQHQRDPVTPLLGGELIAEKFSDRSRLLTVDGSGHGVYVLGKNECAQGVITDYLVEGTMPEQDTTCEASVPNP